MTQEKENIAKEIAIGIALGFAFSAPAIVFVYILVKFLE